MKFHTLTALCAIASTLIATADVPSLINYQGRLTDANGDPVTGSKNFAISIYDAVTGGTLLYTETIGAVTLDDNGVYSFQFGGSGTSNTLVTETIATTDGTSTTFQKVLANSPVVANSVSVSDGTYTWSQSAGSSNEDQFGVVYSTSLRRVTVNYYNGAPATGRTITATYRYGTSGITGALASGAEHWMAISVDGTTQGTRQRVLAVPFAQTAKTAQVSSDATGRLEKRLRDLEILQQNVAMGNSHQAGLIAIDFRSDTATLPFAVTNDLYRDSTGARLLDNKNRSYQYGNPERLSAINAYLSGINLGRDSGGTTPNRVRFIYSDGSASSNISVPNYPNSFFVNNPSPDKKVAQVGLTYTAMYFGYGGTLSEMENIYYYKGVISVVLPSSFLEKNKTLNLVLEHSFGSSVVISAEVVTNDDGVYVVTPGQPFDLNGKSAKIVRLNISHPMDPVLSQGSLTKLSILCTN